MKKGLVSVIIVTLNNLDWLKKCINALREQSYKNIEIFVVDNGSIDNTVSYLKKQMPETICLESGENIGFGRACNLALKKAEGEYVLIYNDDAVCEKDFIKKLVVRIEKDQTIGAIQGTLLFADRKTIIESAGAYLTPTGILIKDFGGEFAEKTVSEKEVFNANLPLIRMSVLKKIGFFDDDYFLYFEEADLCWRIWLSGKRILYYPSAKIYHARGVTTKRLQAPVIVESTFRNRINSLIKNLEIGSLLKILPLHLFICIGGIGAYILKGKPRGALAILEAIVWNLRFINKTIEKRKIIYRFRKKKDSELLPIIMRPMSVSYLVKTSLDYLRQW